jgi:Tfp pilus assembly protein PilV
MRSPRLNGEDGFALIETLVSAVLLVVIALALLAGADRASSTSLSGKSRSVAAALAEQDQERMRSMPVTALSNYHPAPAPPVPVGGVDYTVASRADWVHDTTGATESCADSGQSDYLRITSTVTSNVVGRAIAPVTISSLVAPPAAFGANQGTLAVMVKDSRNQAVVDMNVSVTGPTSRAVATNDAGCAIFSHITAGQYHVQLNAPGWVDPTNTTAVDSLQNVSAGTVTGATLSYDRAAKVAVAYETYVGSATVPSTGWGATALATQGAASWSFRGTAPPQTSVDATSLYPATTGYKFYAGECAGESPETPLPTWFAAAPGSAAVFAPAPGTTNGTVTVRQPPLTLVVKNGSALLSGATVTLTPSDTNCRKLTLTTDASGRANKTTGTPFDPGVPFGKYSVCVAGKISSTTWKRWTSAALNVAVANGPNTVPGTATGGVLDLASNGTSSTTVPTC